MGLIIAPFTIEGPVGLVAFAGSIPAAFTFIAVVVLSTRDHMKRRSAWRRVHQHLEGAKTQSLDSFIADSGCDPAIAEHVRDRMSAFFDVSSNRITAQTSLDDDLHFDLFEPALHMAVVMSLLDPETLPDPKRIVVFSRHCLSTVGELAAYSERWIADLQSGGSGQLDG